jgi:hypothetical protein
LSRLLRGIFFSSALLFALFLVVGCREKAGSPTVRFVIPEGFKGVVEISRDPTGVDLVLENNKVSVVVPSDGRLSVKSVKLIEDAHALAAVYASGRALSLELGPSGTAGVVALHFPAKRSASKPDTFLYFVGTGEGAETFYNQP